MFFWETDRNMTQYWVVFPPLPSVGDVLNVVHNGRIDVSISSSLCTNIHIPKIVGILDVF